MSLLKLQNYWYYTVFLSVCLNYLMDGMDYSSWTSV